MRLLRIEERAYLAGGPEPEVKRPLTQFRRDLVRVSAQLLKQRLGQVLLSIFPGLCGGHQQVSCSSRWTAQDVGLISFHVRQFCKNAGDPTSCSFGSRLGTGDTEAVSDCEQCGVQLRDMRSRWCLECAHPVSLQNLVSVQASTHEVLLDSSIASGQETESELSPDSNPRVALSC
jgi:hypothetical protein